MYQIRTYFGVKNQTQLKYITQYKIILDIHHSLTILDHRIKNNTPPQQTINIGLLMVTFTFSSAV